MANSGSFQHSGAAGVGENLAGVTTFRATLDNCGGEFFIQEIRRKKSFCNVYVSHIHNYTNTKTDKYTIIRRMLNE